jgi:propanol-preferring alcohol dehydrogenase
MPALDLADSRNMIEEGSTTAVFPEAAIVETPPATAPASQQSSDKEIGMQAMVLTQFGPVESNPLVLTQVAVPQVGLGEVRIRVLACGVCRTDIHVVEGLLTDATPPVIPGHQIIGVVDAVSDEVEDLRVGQRVGVSWIHSTCGLCEFCCSNRENLCRNPKLTGCSIDGGYAEYVVAPAEFVFPIDEHTDPRQAAPLLCAGLIAYRALRSARETYCTDLGIVGFGASAHIAIQIARHWGMDVFVFTRSPKHREHAMELGAVWAGEIGQDIGVQLDSVINFTPAGETVPQLMHYLDHGATQFLASIDMTPIPAMNYREHLYFERAIKSITAATRRDGIEFLRLAEEMHLRTDVTTLGLSQANVALQMLKASQITGAVVLDIAQA